MAGLNICGAIGELAPPPRWMAPINTVVGTPSIGTVPNTGEGGRPPPAKTPYLSVDPQVADPISEPMAPDALNRFTQ